MKEYDIIYSDPPWNQKKGGVRKCRPLQGKLLDYQTIDISEIQKHIEMFKTKENSSLFMWTIDKFLFKSEMMANSMGYKIHARMIWNKMNGVAPAFTVRYSHEYLLWMYKGKFQKIDEGQRGKWTTVMEERATVHSRKPEIARRFIESIYPDAVKIELYAREYHEGWDVWGNEV